MIDTFDKSAGSLRQHLDDDSLRAFIELARELGLMTGLAGSLRVADIAPLAALGPDLLGFRGALCQPGGRAAPLSVERVRAVRKALDAVSSQRDATAKVECDPSPSPDQVGGRL